MAEVRQVDPKRFEAVMRLLGERPDLDVEQLRAAVEAPVKRRTRPEPIRPKTAGELVALVEAGVISKARGEAVSGGAQSTRQQQEVKRYAEHEQLLQPDREPGR